MAKYTDAQIEAMGKQGHAFKNPDGHYSYPIGDVEDLKNAIHAVGRGNADHGAIRKYIIGRAKDLGQMALIPDNWNSDGSLNDANGRTSTLEQRAATRNALHNVRETRRCPLDFELRAVPNGTGGENIQFSGYASVTGDANAYEMEDFLGAFTESVSIGAFRKTLSENCDTAFLLNHQGMTLARTKSGTLRLAEHEDGSVTGLHVEAKLDSANPTVTAMRSSIERGDLDEMSFAFRVTRQEWNEDYDRRWINEVSLHQGDVSLVNYGANPHTGGLVAVRKAGEMDWERVFDAYHTANMQLRAGKVLSAAHLASLTTAMDHLGTADTVSARGALQSIIDAAQSGASGNTEVESAPVPSNAAALAELALLIARNRDAEKKRRKAA